MVVIISAKEWQKLSGLKELDIQQCSFCGRTNLLNLGWEPFLRLHCQACQQEHVLCLELCLKVARNLLGCHLFKEVKPVVQEVMAVNRGYDYCACYCCGKELAGASKKGVVKNRNNPSFWGLNTEYKILCLRCVGRKFIGGLSPSKRKTWGKYVRRGYV